MSTCLNCDKELILCEGRRPKKYCDAKCKSNFWVKNKASLDKNEKRVPMAEWEAIQLKIAELEADVIRLRSIEPKQDHSDTKVNGDHLKILENLIVFLNEKIPPERNTSMGKGIWEKDQQRKINSLLEKLKH